MLAYQGARAAIDDSTRIQRETAERIEQEKVRLAARFSARLAAAALAEPLGGRASAQLALAVESEARMAERMVRENVSLIKAEAAARAAERQREQRRADNDQLMAEIVALRRKTSQVRSEAAGACSARPGSMLLSGQWRDEAMDHLPPTHAGEDDVGSADATVRTDLRLPGAELGDAPGSLEMHAEVERFGAAALRLVPAVPRTTGGRMPERGCHSGAVAHALDLAPDPAPRLDSRWAEVARPSSAEAQRRRLQAMRAQMHRPGTSQPGLWLAGEQGTSAALLEELSLDVVQRAAGVYRLGGGAWGVVVPCGSGSASAAAATRGATDAADARVDPAAPTDRPGTAPSPASCAGTRQGSWWEHDSSELWMSIPGQMHAMPRPQAAMPRTASQPRLAPRTASAKGSRPVGQREPAVLSRPLSRASSASQLGRKTRPASVRTPCRGTFSTDAPLETLPPWSASTADAFVARAATPSSPSAHGRFDRPPDALGTAPFYRSGDTPAAGLRPSTRPYSASPWHCGAGASLAGLPRSIPPRPSTAPQLFTPHCIPITDGANHAPNGRHAGWQQVLPRHHAEVRGGGWKKSAQQPRRGRGQAAGVGANVVARSGSAVWSTPAAPRQ